MQKLFPNTGSQISWHRHQQFKNLEAAQDLRIAEETRNPTLLQPSQSGRSEMLPSAFKVAFEQDGFFNTTSLLPPNRILPPWVINSCTPTANRSLQVLKESPSHFTKTHVLLIEKFRIYLSFTDDQPSQKRFCTRRWNAFKGYFSDKLSGLRWGEKSANRMGKISGSTIKENTFRWLGQIKKEF